MNRMVSAVTYMGMIIVVGLAILTGLDVGGRYLFGSPIKGTFELTELFFSSIVAFGIAAATAAEEHILVDILYVKAGPKGQRFLKLLANLAGIVVLAVLVWRGILSGIESIRTHEETALLGLSIPPFRFVLVFGFLSSLIVLICKTVQLFCAKRDGSEQQVF